MYNTLIKLAVWILAIKEVWLLLGVPAVANALIGFLTVGAVPGTNQTLAPDEIYKLIIALFVAVGLLIFRRDIVRLFRKARAGQVERGKPTAMPIPHPLAAIEIVAPTAVSPIETASSGWLQLWAWRMSGLWLLVRIRLAELTSVIQEQILHYAQVGMHYAKIAAHFVTTKSIVVAKFIARESVALWRTVEPYLRRFDRWLEKKLHEYDQTAALLSMGGEVTSALRKWREESKALMRETSPRK